MAKRSAPKKPGKITRRIARGAFYSLVILVMALAGAVLALNQWLKSGRAGWAVSKAVSLATGGEADMGSIHIDMFAGSATGSGLRLAIPDGPEVAVKNFEISVDMASPFRGALLINRVNIDRPSIRLVMKKEIAKEAVALEKAAEKPEAAPSASRTILIPIGVRSFSINGFSADVSGEGLALNLSGLDFDIEGDASPSGVHASARLSAAQAASMFIKKDELEIKGAPRINITASVEKNKNLRVDGDIEIAFERIAAGVGIEPGMARLDLKAKGDIREKPSVSGGLSGSIYGDSSFDAVFEAEDRGYGYHALVTLNNLELNLDRIPKELAPEGVKVKGRFFAGPLKARALITPESLGGAEYNIAGKARAELTEIHAPGVSIPQGARIDIDASNLALAGDKYAAKVAAAVGSKGIEAGDIRLREIAANFSADLSGAMSVLKPSGERGPTAVGDVNLKITATEAGKGDIKTADVVVEGSAAGSLLEGDLHKVTGSLALGKWAKSSVAGAASDFGRKDSNLTASAAVSLDKIKNIEGLPAIPVDISSGILNARANIKGTAGKDWAAPRLSLDLTAGVSNLDAAEKDGKFGTRGAMAKMTASGFVASFDDVRDIKARLEFSSRELYAAGMFTSGPLKLDVSASSPGLLEKKVNAGLALESESVRLEMEGAALEPFGLTASIEARADAASERYTINKAVIGAGAIGSVGAEGDVDWKNKKFSAKADLANLDLEKAFSLARENIRKSSGLERIKGLLSASARGGGKIPLTAADMGFPPPFDASVAISLADGAAGSGEASAEGLNADVRLDVSGKNVKAAGDVEAKTIASESILGPQAIDPSISFDVELAGGRALRIGHISLTVPNLGLASMTEGAVTGFDVKTLMEQGLKPGLVLPLLDADISSYSSLDLEKRTGFEGGLVLAGGASADLSVKASAGKGVTAGGSIMISDFSLSSGGVRIVEDLNGGIPFSKTLLYAGTEKAAPAAPEGKSVRDTVFFENLRGAGERKESVTINKVKAGPVFLEDTVFDLVFSQNRLGVDYFRTSALGGAVTGSLSIKSADGAYVLVSSQKFSGVSVEKILGEKLGHGEQAEVDGVIGLKLSIRPDDRSEDVDISRIEMSVHITRIGPMALDRLLFLVDPSESSPSVARARMVLKYASPVRVDIQAKHGNLSLSMDVKYSPVAGGMTVTMPIIKRFPIDRLAGLGPVREKLRGLPALMTAMKAIGAKEIEITEDGGISLR